MNEAAREALLDTPEAPQAVLQRYVVLTYPSVVDLDQVIQALEAHPDVVWVGKNSLASLSVTSDDYWSPLNAAQTPGYGPYFPGGKTCQIGPCDRYARASVYIFTDFRSPNASPLVPLYRMSFKGTFPGGPSNPNNGDDTYTTEAAGIKTFANVGYRLDGVEGYIYKTCTPEPSCMPPGFFQDGGVMSPSFARFGVKARFREPPEDTH